MNQRRLKSGVRFGFGLSSDFNQHKSRLYTGTIDCLVQVFSSNLLRLLLYPFHDLIALTDGSPRRRHGSVSRILAHLVANGSLEHNILHNLRTIEEILLTKISAV